MMLTLIVFIASIYLHNAQDIQRAYSLYHDDHYMSRLDDEIRKCNDNFEYRSSHVKECTLAEYIQEVSKPPQRSLSLSQKPIPDIVTSDDSYASLFEQKIVNKMPFKGTMTSALSISIEECAQAERMAAHPITSDYPLHSCYDSGTGAALHVPPIAYNNYAIRLQSTGNTSNEAMIDLAHHWPTIVQLDHTQPRVAEKCPLNMHTVVWGASDELTVRVFRDSSGHSLGQTLGNPILHYPSFTEHGYGEKMKGYAETTLVPGEYLFVPHDQILSVKATERSQHDLPTFMRMCFFDASNVNSVRAALHTETMVSTEAKSTLRTLSSPTFFDFSMTRDPPKETPVNVFRTFPRPQTESAEGGEEGGSRRRGRGNDFRAWQEGARWNYMITSLTIPQPPVPTITDVGRNNISLTWLSPYLPSDEDKTKFGVNISVCDSKLLASASADGKLSSLSASEDASLAGCVVISRERSELIERVDEKASAASESPVVSFSTAITGLVPDSSYMLRVMIFYGDAGSHPSLWTRTITTAPETPPYPVRDPVSAVPAKVPTHAVLSFFKPIDNGGLPILGYHVYSRMVNKHHHHSLWVWNGLYEGTSDTKGNTSVEVKNLVPHTTYEFRVASFNELGNSTISDVSNAITTENEKSGTAVVGGINHESRFNSGIFTETLKMSGKDVNSLTFQRLLANQPIPQPASSAPFAIVTINDEAQTLSVYDKEADKDVVFEVWDSHWSPKLFLVHGQAVWTDPPLADKHVVASVPFTDSRHSHDSHMAGKIAVVQRGHVPIVKKAMYAQRAGAIAVIVLDDGQCEAFDQRCMPGSDKKHGERFASEDVPGTWKKIKVPVVLMHGRDTSDFLRLTGLPSYETMAAAHQAEVNTEAEL